jgi:hypothetical protein
MNNYAHHTNMETQDRCLKILRLHMVIIISESYN